MKDLFRLMRPSHWIKNILIFIPAFFARNLWEPQTMKNLILGFLCFSFVSSIVYILNDIKDREKDRMHEVKCNRPIASGAVSIRCAQHLILFVGICAVLASGLMKNATPYVPVIWCMVYFLLNILYSVCLKNIPIVDVSILASGFMIRVFYGAAVSRVTASSWLCLTVMSFALYMGIGKRRNELKKKGESSTRDVLQYYNVELLDKYMMIVTALGIMYYSLWAGMVIDNQWAIWTVPLVLLIIMKYEMVIQEDSFGDPVEVLLSDKVLSGLVLFYVLLMVMVTYVFK